MMLSVGNLNADTHMLDNLKSYRIVLASNSPRRRELLSGLGIDYDIRVLPDIDESCPDDLQGGDIPLFIARRKAEAYCPTLATDELLITADTIVWLDGQVLGKPVDRADAIRMLGMLSGRSHEVFTGVCLTTKSWQRSFVAASTVEFAPLTHDEIAFYVDNFHPFDKAGAYGVQEWIGFIGVRSISGSFFNIMGLPVQMLYRELLRV
jgi:septum formation protein